MRSFVGKHWNTKRNSIIALHKKPGRCPYDDVGRTISLLIHEETHLVLDHLGLDRANIQWENLNEKMNDLNPDYFCDCPYNLTDAVSDILDGNIPDIAGI